MPPWKRPKKKAIFSDSRFLRHGVLMEQDKLTAKQSMAKPIPMIKISIKLTVIFDFKNYTKIQQKYEFSMK